MHNNKEVIDLMFDEERFIQNIHLRNKQKEVNRKYAEEGLTDEVLKMQLEINRLRALHDIPDTDYLFDGFSQ